MTLGRMDHLECDGHRAEDLARGERRQQAEHPAKAAAELGKAARAYKTPGTRASGPMHEVAC